MKFCNANHCLLSFGMAVSMIPAVQSLSKDYVCQDDFAFHDKDHKIYNCDWVANDTANRCSLESTKEGKTVGELNCPVTCGECLRAVTETKVMTNELCYDESTRNDHGHQHVEVTFDNDKPNKDDWMGIYPASADPDNLGIPVMFARLCADPYRQQVCNVNFGVIRFRHMLPGTYKAVLARNSHGGPRASYFESQPFQVMSSEESCSGSSSSSSSDTNTDECKMGVDVDRTNYWTGDDIVVSMGNCQPSHEDFVAIYDADTDLEEIRGDANYKQWLWACGSQYCREAVESNVFAFGRENNKHTWPLPAGSYQAHLIKRLDEAKETFGSVATSKKFTVTETPPPADDCIDSIRTEKFCHEEGQLVTVMLRNECTSLTPEAWIGFFVDEPTKGLKDPYYGEPVLWTHACNNNDNCTKKGTIYHFKLDDRVLPSGNYRVVMVGSEYQEGGPFKADMVSEAFEVHLEGDGCKDYDEDLEA